MDDEHEVALELSVMNIDDGKESDEDLDDLSVLNGHYNDADTQGNLKRHKVNAPPVSLQSILDDERSFKLFKRFVKDTCISRNLQFWVVCEHFRHQKVTDKSRLVESATAVYKKFLGSSAPLHVSIMDGTKRKIQLSIKLKNDLNADLFVQAQSEVYHQMESNELHQFLLSVHFTECPQFPSGSVCTASTYLNNIGFQPPRYKPSGSLHSGSDDSTSVTSFASDSLNGNTHVLCVPRPTTSNKSNLLQSPRNAHSDTESLNTRIRPSSKVTFFSRGKSLTSREFYELLYERLANIDKDRANLQRTARNLAREEGKPYEDIMSLEWFDAPNAIKYVQFSKEGNPADLCDMKNETPSPGHMPFGNEMNKGVEDKSCLSHILSMGEREIQEALKDMEISRQVRQKRTASVLSNSSASSYISDSGLESYLPSSQGGYDHSQPYVQAYVTKQHLLTSKLTDREQKAHLAATMLINNSTHQDDLNPNGRHDPYCNYPGAYSSDDSSSCFTTTSHSSNSEFFVPRRPTPSSVYTDSDTSRQPRYLHGMRRMGHHKRSAHNSSRYYPNNQPHPSQNPSLAPPTSQSPYTSDIQPVHMPPAAASPSPTQSNNENILIVYSTEGCDFNGARGKRYPPGQVKTLGDFKKFVFTKPGTHRYYFKTFCKDINQELMEELSDDNSPLPYFEGKIIGLVERMHGQ